MSFVAALLLLASWSAAATDAEIWQQVLDASQRCGAPCMFNRPDSPKTDQEWAAKLAGVGPEAAVKLKTTRWLTMPQSALDSYTASAGAPSPSVQPSIPPATNVPPRLPAPPRRSGSSPAGDLPGAVLPTDGQNPPDPGQGSPSVGSADAGGARSGAPGESGGSGPRNGASSEIGRAGAAADARSAERLAKSQERAEKFSKTGGQAFGPERSDNLSDPASRPGAQASRRFAAAEDRGGAGAAFPPSPDRDASGARAGVRTGSLSEPPGAVATQGFGRNSGAGAGPAPSGARDAGVPGGIAPRGAGAFSAGAAEFGGSARLAPGAAAREGSGPGAGKAKRPRSPGLSQEDDKDLDDFEKLLDKASKDGRFDRRAATEQLRHRAGAGGAMREQLKAALQLTGRRLSAAERSQILQLASELGLQLDPEEAARLVKGFETAEPPAPEDRAPLTWYERLRLWLRRLMADWVS